MYTVALSEKPMHRRSFLEQILGTCWAGASLLEQAVFRAAQARAQSTSAPANLFDIEKLADGIYGAVSHPAAMTAHNCNSVIFENADNILIVDTHSKPSAAASLAAQIRKEITSKPVAYVVYTHFHWDHTQGGPAYKNIAPRPDFISSTVTRDLLSEHAEANFKASLETLPAALETYRRRMAAAKQESEKSYFQTMISQTLAYQAEMRSYEPVLPNVTFSQDLIIHDKAHDLHLAFRGRGHTAGDIVVYCPQKQVLASGDLLHGWFPYFVDSYPTEWPRTLHALAEFEFRHVLGGHGPVQHTRDRLGQEAEYIQELTEAVAKGKQAGRTARELQDTITPASLTSLAGGDSGYSRFLIDSRFTVSSETDAPAAFLARGVRANVATLFRVLDRG